MTTPLNYSRTFANNMSSNQVTWGSINAMMKSIPTPIIDPVSVFAGPSSFQKMIAEVTKTQNIEINQRFSILGFDIYQTNSDLMKQRRTHRRKRINKKWAKKYGSVPCGVLVMACDKLKQKIESEILKQWTASFK